MSVQSIQKNIILITIFYSLGQKVNSDIFEKIFKNTKVNLQLNENYLTKAVHFTTT